MIADAETGVTRNGAAMFESAQRLGSDDAA